MKVTVVKEWNDWNSTGAILEAGNDRCSFELPGISLQAKDMVVRQVEFDLRSGMSLSDSIEAQRLGERFGNLPRARNVGNDLILIDASDRAGVSDAVDLVKSASFLAKSSRRLLVISGPLELDDDSDYGSLGAFGALMVRLRVAYFFCVGKSARPMYLSVGMEGSWDGESRFSEDAREAYDDLRERIEPGDVILVIGGEQQLLSSLAGRLEEELF